MTPSGAFIYRAHTDGSPVKPHYNMVRHAGALYALNVYDAHDPMPDTEAIIARGLDYMRQNTKPVSDAPADLMPAITLMTLSKNDHDTVLGTTGLGLVAFLTAPTALQNPADRDMLVGLGHFLIYMQKDDGSFYSRYDVQTHLRDDQFASLYYPGEAALALVKLYEWDQTPGRAIWGKGALHALLSMADNRAASKKYPPDNWAMIATVALLRSGLPIGESDYAKLIHHLEGLVISDKAVQQPESSGINVAGSYLTDGKPTQTSARLEGLQTALPYIEDKMLRAETKNSIDRAIIFLRSSQIIEGEFAGAFPETVIPDEKHKHHLLVRIDYIQHALSALMLYRDTSTSNAKEEPNVTP